jgi:hypothetical protein
MTIEVKQIIIKSTVTNTHSVAEDREVSAIDLEDFRERLLEDCRELIATKLDRMRER